MAVNGKLFPHVYNDPEIWAIGLAVQTYSITPPPVGMTHILSDCSSATQAIKTQDLHLDLFNKHDKP
jgi:hypothetical protein